MNVRRAALGALCSSFALALAAEPASSEPGHADLDPDNDAVVAPPDAVPDCEERLRAAKVAFVPAELPVRRSGKGKIVCGADQVVEYRGSAAGIRYRPPPLVTCSLALALSRFETVLQEEASARLHSPIVSIEQAGTFNCRKMSRFRAMVSEHSYANAIDLRSFKLGDGRVITVLRDFGDPEVEPIGDRGAYLRTVARRAFDEAIFSVVLTPFFDALHRDHFHLDMARYRVDGTR